MNGKYSCLSMIKLRLGRVEYEISFHIKALYPNLWVLRLALVRWSSSSGWFFR